MGLDRRKHPARASSVTGAATRRFSQEMPEKLPMDQLWRLTMLESSAKATRKSVMAEQMYPIITPGHHQQGHLPHPPGDQQHEGHGQHGPHEGGGDHAPGAHDPATAQKADHHQGHRHLRPGGNSQDEGPGDGVGEEGLEQEAGHRQGPRPAAPPPPPGAGGCPTPPGRSPRRPPRRMASTCPGDRSRLPALTLHTTPRTRSANK